MEITPEQYARIAAHLPTQRGNVSHENLNVINAILFVAENGCKWRALPKRFGNWHTIYTRMNRWAKAGVLDRLFAELQRRFLDIYRADLAGGTRYFPGMERVLDELAKRGLRTGIVTNKAAWLTEPLLEQMAIRARFDCVVSGDTVAERKPHPLPMLHAARLAGVDPEQCIYVGDALRDVQAAHAAGMSALVALYGYLSAEDTPRAWGGEGHLAEPLDLLMWLDASGRL